MKERHRLYLALGLLLGIIAIFIAYMSLPFVFGKTIVLRTMPIDPFDVFRGQYLSINYEISSLPALKGADSGKAVYVQLQKNDSGLWQYTGSSLSKPASGDFLKGRITYIQGQQMNVEYGIEQYFFERNAEINTTNMSVELRVSGGGQARLVRLLHEGMPLEIIYQEDSPTSSAPAAQKRP
jgi:uncharacterized membrane-anchored protein